MPVEVRDVPDEKRFVATVDDVVAGRVEYILLPDLIVFTHTEVEPAFEGQGVGDALARAVLDEARARGLPVLPQCPFIAAWIERHPGYQDLVYPGSQHS